MSYAFLPLQNEGGGVLPPVGMFPACSCPYFTPAARERPKGVGRWQQAAGSRKAFSIPTARLSFNLRLAEPTAYYFSSRGSSLASSEAYSRSRSPVTSSQS